MSLHHPPKQIPQPPKQPFPAQQLREEAPWVAFKTFYAASRAKISEKKHERRTRLHKKHPNGKKSHGNQLSDHVRYPVQIYGKLPPDGVPRPPSFIYTAPIKHFQKPFSDSPFYEADPFAATPTVFYPENVKTFSRFLPQSPSHESSVDAASLKSSSSSQEVYPFSSVYVSEEHGSLPPGASLSENPRCTKRHLTEYPLTFRHSVHASSTCSRGNEGFFSNTSAAECAPEVSQSPTSVIPEGCPSQMHESFKVSESVSSFPENPFSIRDSMHFREPAPDLSEMPPAECALVQTQAQHSQYPMQYHAHANGLFTLPKFSPFQSQHPLPSKPSRVPTEDDGSSLLDDPSLDQGSSRTGVYTVPGIYTPLSVPVSTKHRSPPADVPSDTFASVDVLRQNVNKSAESFDIQSLSEEDDSDNDSDSEYDLSSESDIESDTSDDSEENFGPFKSGDDYPAIEEAEPHSTRVRVDAKAKINYVRKINQANQTSIVRPELGQGTNVAPCRNAHPSASPRPRLGSRPNDLASIAGPTRVDIARAPGLTSGPPSQYSVYYRPRNFTSGSRQTPESSSYYQALTIYPGYSNAVYHPHRTLDTSSHYSIYYCPFDPLQSSKHFPHHEIPVIYRRPRIAKNAFHLAFELPSSHTVHGRSRYQNS